MRLVVARMNHETNSFSPVPTPLDSFGPSWHEQAYETGKHSCTAMGAFLDLAADWQAEVATPVFAMAYPSGPVADDAFENMAESIVEAARQPCDAILLDLHGAMVTNSLNDAEGELLARLRQVAPHTPIGVALDLHANITARMVEHADHLVGFKTYPHIDMYETGEHVGQIMAWILEQGSLPAQACSHPPILAQTMQMNTNEPGAMTAAVEKARALEQDESILAVTVFGGFSLSDLPETGLSIVAVARDGQAARQAADALGQQVWHDREGFIYREPDLASQVQTASQAAHAADGRPVLMLDHGDNCMSGGTCDTMTVLQEVLAQGLQDVLIGPIADPQAVASLRTAGLDNQVTVTVGNRWDLRNIGFEAQPLELTGRVQWLGQGQYVISGPIYTGMACDMGAVAVLQTEQATVLIAEQPHEPWDMGVFACAGLDPSAYRFLVLKSRMYCRPVFEPLAHAVVECPSPGVTSSDFTQFTYKQLARPIYPLDEQVKWHGQASACAARVDKESCQHAMNTQ